jgi:uncharacterized protein
MWSSVPPIEGVATSVAGFVGPARRGPLDRPVVIRTTSQFVREFGAEPADTPLAFAVAQFFAHGGAQALVVRVSGDRDVDDQVSGPAARRASRGVWALTRAAMVNLVCIPPYGWRLADEISDRTRQAALEFCHEHRAFFVADPPARWQSVADVLDAGDGVLSIDWRTLPREHGALYYPRLVVRDPADAGAVRLAPACGAVAGVMARLDAARGIWKAPGGVEATLAADTVLAAALSGDEMALLTARGVNVLRTLPRGGPVVWGSRTLAGGDDEASDWRYVPVRRTADWVAASVGAGLGWVVFEPNDEPLWSRVRDAVDLFLHGLFRQGAFQGASPREAYFVKCDADTMTEVDVRAGRLNLIIGLALLRPSEFVIVRVHATTAQR